MIEPTLHPTAPAADVLPFELGGLRLAALPLAPICSVAPFRGQAAAVNAALGHSLPGPGQTLRTGDALWLWMGRDQCFVIGPAPQGLAGLAAVTDQSDGWARFTLTSTNPEYGPECGAAAVLARLCPLDLSPQAFGKAAVARSELAHMMAAILRVEDGFAIMVMRSFAGTAVHDLREAMRSVVAQSGLREDDAEKGEMVPAPGLEPGTS